MNLFRRKEPSRAAAAPRSPSVPQRQTLDYEEIEATAARRRVESDRRVNAAIPKIRAAAPHTLNAAELTDLTFAPNLSVEVAGMLAAAFAGYEERCRLDDATQADAARQTTEAREMADANRRLDEWTALPVRDKALFIAASRTKGEVRAALLLLQGLLSRGERLNGESCPDVFKPLQKPPRPLY